MMKEKSNNGFLSIFKENFRVIIAWTTVFLFFFLSFWDGFLISFFHAFLLTACLLLVSRIESIYLIKLLKSRKNFLFYIINFVMIISMSLFSTYIESTTLVIVSKYLSVNIPNVTGLKAFFLPFLLRIIFFTASVAITAISVLQKDEKESLRIKEELKSEKLDMELKFLKSQITPHFLFNALNNIYSLVYIKDEKAPQSVLKLSEMLRYVMVDCQVDLISLDKEVKYIDAYIDFQQMSMEKKSNVTFDKDIENSSFAIPPMILQPLVENSFKHSRLVNDPDGYIHFYLKQEKDSMTFKAINSIKGMSLSVIDPSKKHSGGIGLKNVKSRLELYYSNKHVFEIKQEDNCYEVLIKIGGKNDEEKV